MRIRQKPNSDLLQKHKNGQRAGGDAVAWGFLILEREGAHSL